MYDNDNLHYSEKERSFVVEIIQKEGIQGRPGKSGITPHIDKETGHWFLADVDTGVSAGGLSKDDLSLLQIFETKAYFPKEGKTKDIYVDKKASTFYSWNEVTLSYEAFKPVYAVELENALRAVNASLNIKDKKSLKKPTNIIPGSLVLLDAEGNANCTNVTFEELLNKVNASHGTGCNCDVGSNIIPGALVIGSEDGRLESSVISQRQLVEAIDKTKRAAIFSNNVVVAGSLVTVNEDGTINATGKSVSQLLDELRENSPQADWSETNEESPSFVKNKPALVSREEFNDLTLEVNKKVALSGAVSNNAIVVANKDGTLRCSDVSYEDLVTFKNIVAGSKSDYTYVESNETYVIQIPSTLKKYPSICVYHNGNLLMEGLHYTLNKGFIVLRGFYAYKSDIFSFVGYGSTVPSFVNTSPTPETPNIIAGSKSEYVSVKEDEERVITIPKDVRVFPAINVYHNGSLLVEGLHYSIDRDFISLNGFFAYKNDVFNFVGYGSASLITDEQNTNHTHANKTILDTIIAERVEAWDTITTHDHDHAYLKNTEAISPSLLPTATDYSLGVVKSSMGANKVTVAEDGTMSVEKIDVKSIIATDQSTPEGGEDYSIVLSSGSAGSYKNDYIKEEQ